MKEIGKVIEINGNSAIVLMEEKEKCKSCNLCKKILPREPKIEAENIIKASIGDIVEVEINEDALFKISVFIYGFPLLGFILGIVFSYFLKIVFLKVIVFLIFLTSFWIIGFQKGKFYSQKTKPKIVSKV
ncbi:MAG: SoxR reducing system RseC family protein [Candidatus Omnitrophica bacterium]|nr:SoxR reducing system RseC family protein [Candidatus Omnitrophota bacterium]MCM8802776.1 SoxR reducing system RseC family protein [Candidatus Omnitrophota bacterium]